ncbi:MAG: ABC-type transporter, periplasmic subunit [Candidatus Eremiobacteraeota bacterium]|nr:ABC-type transporter, periplasmic subunit [Candidatus Eremiobacteraeota bacterium]
MTTCRIVAAVLSASVALLAPGCSRAVAPVPNASLRVGFSTEPHSLNPVLMQNGQEMVIDRFFSDPLTSYDPSGGRVVPILAARVPTRENGDISANGKLITFHLRHGVRWQDGAPFDSADVVFTFHQVMNPANNVVSRIGYDHVTAVDAPDAYTVRFRLARPYAPIVTTLFGDANTPYGILPAHLLRGHLSLGRLPFDQMPVGTGPFRVVRWQRGDRIELEANPHYFLGTPKLQRVTIVFAREEQTLVTMVRAHEIDWAAELGPPAAAAGRSIAGYQVVLVPQNRWYGLMFNMARPIGSAGAVRRAIELGIDKRTLARSLTYGTALPATQDLPSFLWAYPKVLRSSPYDPAAARALLARSGWTAARPLHIDLAFSTNSDVTRRAVVALQSMLANVNITVQLRGYTNELFTGPAQLGGILSGGRFDLALARILNGPEPDNSAEYSCAAVSPNGYNFMRYCSAEMDRWQTAALASYDRPVRAAAYGHIEAILERDLPQIPIWWPRDVHLVATNLQNFTPNPFVETWNAYRWSLR